MSTLKTNNKQLAARKHEQYNKILTKLHEYIYALIPTEQIGIHEDATHAQLQPLLDKARELGYELVKLDIDPEQECMTRVNKDLPKLRKMIKKLSALKKDILQEWEMMNSDIPKEAQNISQNFYPEYQELEKIEEEIENDPISQCALKMKELKQAVKKHFQVQNTKQLKKELIEKGYGTPGDFRVKMTWILIYQRFVLGAEAEKESLAAVEQDSVQGEDSVQGKVAQTNQQLPLGFHVESEQKSGILRLYVKDKKLAEYTGKYIEFSNLFCRNMGHQVGRCVTSLKPFEDFIWHANNYKLKVFGFNRSR